MRPLNEFLIFNREQRKNFSGDGSKKMSEIWKSMTQEEKMPYVLKAKEERLRYKKDMEAYTQQRERERNSLYSSSATFGYPVIAPQPQNPPDTRHLYLDSPVNNPVPQKHIRQSVGSLVPRKEKPIKDKSGFTWVHKTKYDFEESSGQSNTNSEDSNINVSLSRGSLISDTQNLNITDSVNTLGASLPDVGTQSLYLDADQIREMLSHTHVHTVGQNLNRTLSQPRFPAYQRRIPPPSLSNLNPGSIELMPVRYVKEAAGIPQSAGSLDYVKPFDKRRSSAMESNATMASPMSHDFSSLATFGNANPNYTLEESPSPNQDTTESRE
ncbi:hypothetical protein HK103_005038 [Boothiomyces macroporosus]|uniref:HMG box domain-containing protein n=1 Tax=Boothiomyces macroporosus TaxID=261099 RepID=A0AAD5Y813_9FUNG|nr:hypothetical protein HK103_005038 [Boothiomyces macroporosus]